MVLYFGLGFVIPCVPLQSNQAVACDDSTGGEKPSVRYLVTIRIAAIKRNGYPGTYETRAGQLRPSDSG